MCAVQPRHREVAMAVIPKTATASEQARAQAFVELGFDTTQALMLAATRDAGEHVELDAVRELLDRGCPHKLALRILV
jgi:hypothetical protein